FDLEAEVEPKRLDQRSSPKKLVVKMAFSCPGGLDGAGLEAHGANTVAPAAATIAAIIAEPVAVGPVTVAPVAVAPVAVLEHATARAAVAAGQGAVLAELSATQRAIRGALLSGNLQSVSATMSRYDELVVALMLRVVELETRIAMPPPMTSTMRPNAVGQVATPVAPVPVPRTKVRETWSCVVKGTDPELSSRQIAEKVRKEVAPALGVRVHEVRELKRGGAIIRTPSASEASKVAASRKFAEVGLRVERNQAVKPRLTVYEVDTALSPEEF
ncbi:hypothetical protein KR067_006015, partial [Drosophila pandora]